MKSIIKLLLITLCLSLASLAEANSKHYGVKNPHDIFAMVKKVDSVKGLDAPYANQLMLETISVETAFSHYQGPSKSEGLTQINRTTFDYLKGKYENTRLSKSIAERLHISLSRARYDQLGDNPELAILFGRLVYVDRVAHIPHSRLDRGRLWKKKYNTYAGSGTVKKYMEKSRQYLG